MLVRALGPLAVQPDDNSPGTRAGPLALGGPRQRTVLAALVMHAGQVVPLTALEDAVWPDGPPPAATGTMQAYISRLRALLGSQRLVRTDGGYRLALARSELDEWVLADAVRDVEDNHQCDRALTRLADTLTLWRGRPLGDIGSELFAAPYVTALDQLHVRAVSLAAERMLECDDVDAAVEVLTTGISEHPYDQPLVALYMSAQARRHRPDAALTAYRTLAERLKRDLEVVPDEHVRSIARTVAAADPSARAAVQIHERRTRSPNAALPDPGSPLVGRREELRALRDAVSRHRVVTVVGPPGAGKSRLALEATWLLAPACTGACHVALEGVRDSGSLLRALAASCAVQEQPGVPVASTMARAFRARRRFVLLLDSAEHLGTAAVDDLRALVESCPELLVVVTSLEPTGLAEEQVLRLSPLPVPEQGGRLLDADAGRLLLGRARVAQPGFAVSPVNESTLVDIVRSLDGLPLALELAAGQLAVLGPTELARRLSDRFAVLLRPGVSGRHVSMHAALSTAVDELSDEQRSVLTRLGVTAGPLPLDVAEDLCRSADGHTPASPRATLMALARRSLLVVDERGVGMLESVRAFCAERLRRRGEWEHAVHRHGALLTSRLEDLTEHAHSTRQGWAAREVARLYPELRTALARLPEQEARPLAALVSPWWYRSGRLSDLSELAMTFVCDGQGDVDAVSICGYAALAVATEGTDWDRARRLAEGAVAAAESSQDAGRKVEARLLRGDVATLVGDFDTAASDLDYVIERADRPWMVALARLRRLRVDWASDPSGGGLSSQRRAATAQAVQDAGDPQLVGYLQLTKGNRLLHMGHLRTAGQELLPATRTFEDISHHPFHTLGMLLVAQLETLRGRWEQAERLAHQVLQRGQGTAAPFPWDPREILARRRIDEGDFGTALAVLAELEQEAINRGDAILQAVCVVDRVTAQLDDHEAVTSALASAPPAAELPPWQQVDLLVAEADAALMGGDLTDAVRAVEQARATMGALGEPALVHQARLELTAATLSISKEEPPRATVAHLSAGERLREESGYALSAAERRRYSEALRHCRSAMGERALAEVWAG